MIGYGVKLSIITRLRTFQGIPGLSYTWVTLSVPVGCALMLVSAVRRLRGLFQAARHGEPAHAAQGSSEII
jgi:TRAP-type C4-dicarboxylate transport system permease small subunit